MISPVLTRRDSNETTAGPCGREKRKGQPGGDTMRATKSGGRKMWVDNKKKAKRERHAEEN